MAEKKAKQPKASVEETPDEQLEHELEHDLEEVEHELEDGTIDHATALRRAHALIRTVVKTYHRAESSGVENVPAEGGVLIVSNHSGGVIAMDVPVIATALWDTYGVERDFRVLAHDLLMSGAIGKALSVFGFVAANAENAAAALRDGAVTVVFPGGDWEAYRPTTQRATIDFNGRTGYIKTALAAGVPIVPVVSIGGQETQIFLSRGEGLAKRIPWMRNMRTKVAPIVVGFPFGVSVGLPQWPLPSKIVTRFLEPIDLAQFGEDPDLAEIDALIRERMQTVLDELAAERRFPVLG